jgi:hypothetical protein
MASMESHSLETAISVWSQGHLSRVAIFFFKKKKIVLGEFNFEKISKGFGVWNGITSNSFE